MARLLSGQILFTSIPDNLQLIARDNPAGGHFTVSGKVPGNQYTKIRSRLVSSDNYSQVLKDTTSALGADSSFSFVYAIPAQLKEFDLIISLIDNAGEHVSKLVSRLVCGDYFIISGQSNALAPAAYPDTAYMRPWLRGIGRHEDPQDSTFPCEHFSVDFAEASPVYLQQGFVGSWGLKLQYGLAMYTGMPSCFINGARAGSSIQQNLASHTPSDPSHLDSCNGYDRLYKKVVQHKLNPYLRAMFWYQGETDGLYSTDSACAYMDKFDRLYASWKADYPNLEKIFLLQVNTGCTDHNLGLVREIQRKISYKYHDIIILSTFSTDTADRSKDVCHYTLKGYNQLGDNILPVVKKYIYGAELNDDDILPPKIARVLISGPSQLCLEFDKDVVVQQYTPYANGTAYIKDYFYDESQNTLSLSGVSADSTKVYLNFTGGAALPQKITYLPPSFSRVPSLYTGPYILNKRNPNLAALSFYDFPVTASGNNGWKKEWTNSENDRLDTGRVADGDVFYRGNFTGDAADELLYISTNNMVTASLLSYTAGAWNNLWTGSTFSGKNSYDYRNSLIAADVDGDGLDELFANGATIGLPSFLFKFANGVWQQLWTDNGSTAHPAQVFGYRLYAGDLDGDGKAELMGFDNNSPGEATLLRYQDHEWVTATWTSHAWSKLLRYRDHLFPADYNGDGRTDLLGFDGNSAMLFMYDDESWQCAWSNKNVSAIGTTTFSLASDKIVTGDVDGDNGDELVLIGKDRMAIMNFKEGGNWHRCWLAQASGSYPAQVCDWRFDLPDNALARYYVLRTAVQQPCRLLAMRKEKCRYLVDLYTTDSVAYDPANAALENACGEADPGQNNFLLYPNPAAGLVTAEVEQTNLHSTLSLIDLQGRVLQQLKDQNGLAFDLYLKGYQKGIYIVKLENSNGILVKKLVIE